MLVLQAPTPLGIASTTITFMSDIYTERVIPYDTRRRCCIVSGVLEGFKLLKSGTSNALCAVSSTAKQGAQTYLWSGKSSGRDDCQSKCVSNSKCKFFSYWHNTKWCQIHHICNHWRSNGSHMISTYERSDGKMSQTLYGKA